MYAITLFTLITIIFAYDLSPGGAFSTQDLIAHHIAKRQTAADDLFQDIAECIALISEYQCGSSGYAQQSINIALGCRNESYARYTANICARNENGETCGAAVFKFFLSDSDQMNAGSCSGAVSSGSCPSNCHSFLELARSKLGCCISTFINTTYNHPFLSLNSDQLDYHLWNLCDVPLPAAACGNTLHLNPPQISHKCTTHKFKRLISDYQCMPSVGQPLVNVLLQNKCSIFPTFITDVCATNANGQHCVEVLAFDLIAGSSADPMLLSLSDNCAGLVDTCSPSCHSAITNIADTYGCCVNIYNSTETGVQLSSLSYSLWNACRVDSPGVCNSSLTTSPEESDQYPSTNSPSSLEFDASTSGSWVLALVNWIIAMATLLHLKELF